MAIRKRNIFAAAALSCLAGLVFALPWEGAAMVASYGDFPQGGYYAACNSFPRNTSIEVQNLETGAIISVIVTRGMDNSGVFMLLSVDAGKALGLEPGKIIRVKAYAVSVETQTAQTPAENASKYDSDFHMRQKAIDELRRMDDRQIAQGETPLVLPPQPETPKREEKAAQPVAAETAPPETPAVPPQPETIAVSPAAQPEEPAAELTLAEPETLPQSEPEYAQAETLAAAGVEPDQPELIYTDELPTQYDESVPLAETYTLEQPFPVVTMLGAFDMAEPEERPVIAAAEPLSEAPPAESAQPAETAHEKFSPDEPVFEIPPESEYRVSPAMAFDGEVRVDEQPDTVVFENIEASESDVCVDQAEPQLMAADEKAPEQIAAVTETHPAPEEAPAASETESDITSSVPEAESAITSSDETIITLQPAEPVPPPSTPEPVYVEPVPQPAATPPPLAAERPLHNKYYIQVAAFSSEAAAMDSIARLTAYKTMVEQVAGRTGSLWKVYVGPLERDESGIVLLKIRGLGYKDAFVHRGS